MRIGLTCIPLFFTCMLNAQVPGSIIDPAVPAINPMNPDGNGFITSTDVAFSGPLDENEFELPFLPILQYHSEPGDDNQVLPPCSLFDFVNDPALNVGSAYYYYTDPDGISDNGDELIIFRFRLARFSNGVSGFSVLMDTDYRFGFSGPEADPNAVPGNPGFEREIAAFSSTGSDGGVRVFNVDGKDTASVINYAASIHNNYQMAYALNQDPGCSIRLPVFVDMFVPFSALGISSLTQVRMAVAANEDPKTALKGGASDVAGVNGYLIPDDDDQFIAAITNYSPIAIGDPTNQAPLGIDATVSLDENTPIGTSVHAVSASDPNGDILAYSITGGNTASTFAINSASGQITVNNAGALDRETTASFTLTVKITDGKLYDNAIVTIQLNDVNEKPPSLSDAVVLVDENSANGLLVHTVKGTDPDAAPQLSYSITAGNTDAVFVIHSTTGEVRVNNTGALDFETVPSFTLTVGVSDGSFFDDATLTIHLNDVNEPPSGGNAMVAVDENSVNGTLVHTMSANDPDAGAVLKYTIISGNTSNAFRIDDVSGTIRINNSLALDFETTPIFHLSVRVTDGSLFSDALINIHIQDVNEPPVVADISSVVERRLTHNDIITTVMATDPDANDVLFFQINGGNADGMFDVDDRTGDILLQDATKFNREFRTYDLEVSATDVDGLTGWGRVRITMARKPDRDDIHPQKGFSPDGNGNNDFWLIEGIEAFPDNTIQVYNRWGIPVFETQGYDNDRLAWRGEGKGTSANAESTYFFIIKAADFAPITGYVIVKP